MHALPPCVPRASNLIILSWSSADNTRNSGTDNKLFPGSFRMATCRRHFEFYCFNNTPLYHTLNTGNIHLHLVHLSKRALTKLLRGSEIENVFICHFYSLYITQSLSLRCFDMYDIRTAHYNSVRATSSNTQAAWFRNLSFTKRFVNSKISQLRCSVQNINIRHDVAYTLCSAMCVLYM